MPFGNVKLNDGHEIPGIAFGTGSSLRDRDATQFVAQALEAGFEHIDTAQYYQNEGSVGEAIRESGLTRSELFITTKYSSGPIQESVRSSLVKLGMKQVDLYLIHRPSAVAPDFEEAWKEFERIKEAGLAKSIGVSNFDLEQLQTIMKVAEIKPAVNQTSFCLFRSISIPIEHKALLGYCAKHGIVIEAYSSLAPITKYPGGPVDAAVNAAAKCRNATPGQIIFDWVRAKGAVIVTTTSSRSRLQEYLDAGDITPLTDEEIQTIDDASAKGPPQALFALTREASPLIVTVVFSFLLLMSLIAGYRHWAPCVIPQR